MLKDKLPYLVRILSLIILLSIIGLLTVSFLKRGSQLQTQPQLARTKSGLSGKVVAITEGYQYVNSENGREKFRLLAARDISYDDGHHELEKLELIAFDSDGSESARISADFGLYRQSEGIITFTGNVIVSSADGLEVKTDSLSYNQHTRVANTEVAINFRRAEMSGSSVGAALYTRERNLALLKDAHLLITASHLRGSGTPLEIHAQRADFAQLDGVVRFTGEVHLTHGLHSARAEMMTGVFQPRTYKLLRIEMRGNAVLYSNERGKAAEIKSQDMDFLFDEEQRLKLVVAASAARARSLEKDAPREIAAEKLEAHFTAAAQGSQLASIVSQGRTVVKFPPVEGASGAAGQSERVLEADTVVLHFRPDGKYLQRAEATGQAVLTVRPPAGPQAEIKRLRAPHLTAQFYETNNAVRSFLADGGVVAEFEPLPAASLRRKRVLSGKKLVAIFEQAGQEIVEMTLEGEAKFTDGERTATAARAVYTAAAGTVALRGKPLVWDAVARTSATELDANIETGETVARGRVQTTYYSRETTGGAAPFKKKQAPIFIAAESAVVRHREGAARYQGNARAWQDDNFVRAETIELDKNERLMQAFGSVESALYEVEREVTKGGKELVPIFATADQLSYTEARRVVRYEGNVKLRQGADRLEAAQAEAFLSEEHKLERLLAQRNVVLLQPSRRATGDQVEYQVASDTVTLTGNLARVEAQERERLVTTSGARLTLHLRDAKIEADDEGGTRRVRTTHRIQP
jgi:lipopolysaccharide export system protein LptA